MNIFILIGITILIFSIFILTIKPSCRRKRKLYGDNERYHKYLSCPTCLFIAGRISENVICNKELPSRRHIQINKQYEACIIDTFRTPEEALMFNQLHNKKYRFQYWCWKCDDHICSTVFQNKDAWLEHLKKRRIYDYAIMP